jgi:hypothetical protein
MLRLMIGERLREVDRRFESRVPLSLREEVRGRAVLVMGMQIIVVVSLSLSHDLPYLSRFLCVASVIVLTPLLRHSWHKPAPPPEVEPLGRVEWPRG